MIKVLFKGEEKMHSLTLQELEEKVHFHYLKSLDFPTDQIIEKVLKQSKKAMKRKDLSIRERWLGVRFQKEISEDYEPNFSIRWIDEVLRYGVFAEADIAVGAYIGEYTGLVRKRRKRVDRKNDYCFEYTIGDWVYNPFIIDAKDQGNFTRFINHSEDPNVESLSVYVEELMHIIFVALKPIKKDAQLCYHYGDIFWKKRRHAEIQLVDL